MNQSEIKYRMGIRYSWMHDCKDQNCCAFKFRNDFSACYNGYRSSFRLLQTLILLYWSSAKTLREYILCSYTQAHSHPFSHTLSHLSPSHTQAHEQSCSISLLSFSKYYIFRCETALHNWSPVDVRDRI